MKILKFEAALKRFLKDISQQPPQIVVVSYENDLPDEWTDILLHCVRQNISVLSKQPMCMGGCSAKVPSDHIDALWLLTGMSIFNKPYLLFKRVMDIFFSIIGLAIMACLFPIIFLAIKMSSRGQSFLNNFVVSLHGRNFTHI
ncbi:MAG: sugar transferase [bacterium]|nr:sugar transferase [bacterium]